MEDWMAILIHRLNKSSRKAADEYYGVFRKPWGNKRGWDSKNTFESDDEEACWQYGLRRQVFFVAIEQLPEEMTPILRPTTDEKKERLLEIWIYVFSHTLNEVMPISCELGVRMKNARKRFSGVENENVGLEEFPNE